MTNKTCPVCGDEAAYCAVITKPAGHTATDADSICIVPNVGDYDGSDDTTEIWFHT